MKSRAIVFESPMNVEINEFELPKLEEGQILTRTLLSGVSTGTETRVLSGQQDGADFPLIPGYENLGEVIEVAPNCSLRVGDRVFVGKSESTGHFNKAWGAHLEYAVVNENAKILVPDNVTDEEAVYAKIGAISLHGVKRSEIVVGEKAVVVGLGVIGALAALCCKAYGAEVIGVDPSKTRLQNLNNSSIDHLINPAKEDLIGKVKDITNGGADVVIDATGIASLADSSAQLLKDKDWDDIYHPSGRFVLLGTSIDPVTFQYNDTLFMKEINILPSRDTVVEDLKDMLNLISSKSVETSVIPQHFFNFEEAQTAYKKLVEEKLMRIVFDWRRK